MKNKDREREREGKFELKIDNSNPDFFFSDNVMHNGYSSLLSFTVNDINSTITKLMALGAELDGPIKYEIHRKVFSPLFLHPSLNYSYA